MLFGALLVSPAWAQEPADPQTPTRLSFDLRSDSLKKIVRDTAATQSATSQPASEAPVRPSPRAAVVYVPPEKKAKPAEHKVLLPSPVPESGGFLSALVDVLPDRELDNRVICPSDEDLKTIAQGYEHCPGVNGRLGFVPPIK